MDPPLTVEIQDEEIVVTKPGTQFSARYHKPFADSVLRLVEATVDSRADPDAIYAFRAKAFAAALRKARELGWIV
jgi:hypothetical protein